MNDIKLEVPFQGFYNSIHSLNIDNAFEQEHTDDGGELDTDACQELHDTTDMQKVYVEYAKHYVEQLNSELQFDLTFNQLHSPREYNFETDTIEVLIAEDDLDVMFKVLCAKYNKELRAFIANELEPRDGFIPHYSNDLNDWLDDCNYEPSALATPQITLLLAVYISECTDFDEAHLMDDVNSNGYLTDWIYAAVKLPEPEPEPRTISISMEHFDNATNQRDAIKNVIMQFTKVNLLSDDLDVRDQHDLTHTNFARVMGLPSLHPTWLKRALADDNRYIDVLPMVYRDDDKDGRISTLAQSHEEAQYYDYMVRGDVEDGELCDVMYYEAENVAPADAECVQQVLEHVFELTPRAETDTKFVIQGRREGDDDDVCIIEALNLNAAIDTFVANVLDCEGQQRDEDYFIIGGCSLTQFLRTNKVEVL